MDLHHGVATDGDQRCHVARQRRTLRRPPQMMRLPRNWPLSRLSGATPTAPRSSAANRRHQLRQLGDEGASGLIADARNALEELCGLSPQRANLDALIDLRIELTDLLFEQFQDGYDTPTDLDRGGDGQAVLFAGADLDQLLSSFDEFLQLAELFVGNRPDFRADRVPKVEPGLRRRCDRSWPVCPAPWQNRGPAAD